MPQGLLLLFLKLICLIDVIFMFCSFFLLILSTLPVCFGSLCYSLFSSMKFYLFILNVLWFQHHERSFHFLLSFSSLRLNSGLCSHLLESLYWFPPVLIAKELVQLTTKFQSYALSHPSSSVGLDFVYPQDP